VNAISGGQNTEIWEPSRPSRISTLPGGTHGLGMRFSPDGHRLCLPGGTAAYFYRTDTGAQVAEFGKGHGGTPNADWSPDGRHMVLCVDRGTRGELEVVSTANDFAYAEDSLPLPLNMGAAWSPDGKLISGSSQNSLVRAWKSRDGEWRPAWTAVQLPGDDWATFSGGGKLLSSSDQARRHLVAVVERTNGTVETLPFHEFVARQTPLPPLKSVDAKAERAVATTLLDLKAPFTVRVGPKDVAVAQRDDLPNEEFVIVAVTCTAQHRIDDRFIERLVQCRRLETLVLAESLIGDEALASIGQMTSLKSLRLANLRLINPPALRHLAQLQRLESLTLFVRIDTAALAAVATLPRLKDLNLLSVTGAADFSVLAAAPQLHQLVLFGSQLETQPTAVWSRFAALRYLQLQGPTPRAIEIAAALPQLETLDLYCQAGEITPEVLRALAQVRNVQRLNITSESPVAFAAWLKLRRQLPDSTLLFAQGKELPPGLSDPPPLKGLSFDDVRSYVTVPSLKFDPQQSCTVEAVCVAEPIYLQEGSQTLFSWADNRFHVDFVRQAKQPDLGEWHALWHPGREDLALHPFTLPKPLSDLLLRRTHVAAVRDGERLTLFVNGRRESTASEATPAFPQKGSSEIFVIGAGMRSGNHAPYNPFAGVIERLRGSKSVRYTDDYEPPAEYAVDADTLAVYRFDEGRGTTLNDASGNKHHGTIVDATWVDTTKPAADR